MPYYYRFQHDEPRRGETVHCFTTLNGLKGFASFMKNEDPDFHRMKFWEIEGSYVRDDEGDVVVKVISARRLHF